jgi:hypothetical protein
MLQIHVELRITCSYYCVEILSVMLVWVRYNIVSLVYNKNFYELL